MTTYARGRAIGWSPGPTGQHHSQRSHEREGPATVRRCQAPRCTDAAESVPAPRAGRGTANTGGGAALWLRQDGVPSGTAESGCFRGYECSSSSPRLSALSQVKSGAAAGWRGEACASAGSWCLTACFRPPEIGGDPESRLDHRIRPYPI